MLHEETTENSSDFDEESTNSASVANTLQSNLAIFWPVAILYRTYYS